MFALSLFSALAGGRGAQSEVQIPQGLGGSIADVDQFRPLPRTSLVNAFSLDALDIGPASDGSRRGVAAGLGRPGTIATDTSPCKTFTLLSKAPCVGHHPEPEFDLFRGLNQALWPIASQLTFHRPLADRVVACEGIQKEAAHAELVAAGRNSQKAL